MKEVFALYIIVPQVGKRSSMNIAETLLHLWKAKKTISDTSYMLMKTSESRGWDNYSIEPHNKNTYSILLIYTIDINIIWRCWSGGWLQTPSEWMEQELSESVVKLQTHRRHPSLNGCLSFTTNDVCSVPLALHVLLPVFHWLSQSASTSLSL